MQGFRALISFIVLIFLWQLIVTLFSLPNYILPSPFDVAQSLWLNTGIIAHQAIPTIIETLSGLGLGIVIGIITALFLSNFKFARLWFLPLVIVSQSIPTFAIAPLLVIWFGYGMGSKIITAIIMLFFPVTSTFYDGLNNTPKAFLDLAKVMQATKLSILLKIKFPAALPQLASGIRMAAVIAPIGAVVGEWVGASRGLGYLMLNANARMQIDLMFAVLLVIIIFALSLYYLLDCMLNRLMPWSKV